MKTVWAGLVAVGCGLCAGAGAQAPFTLRQVMSAPYATDLTPDAYPSHNLFAWVEHTEGRNNLFVGGPASAVRQLTHNTEDDGQDIRDVAWSPDGKFVAYTYGAEGGASGRPANPDHLQRATPLQVILQPLDPAAAPVVVGEGHAPLFTDQCRSLLFVRAGQVWISELPAAWACPPPGPHGNVDLPASPTSGPAAPHQLVFDRGSASHLVVSSISQSLLAFISTRHEANGPSHSFVALFDMKRKTLSFPGASTGDDLSPTFVDGGSYLAWIRKPFTEAREFAPNRVSRNPWSIQLLQLLPQYDDRRDYPEGYTWPVRTIYAPTAGKPGSVLPHMATGDPKLLFPDTATVVFSSEADGWIHLYSLAWDSGEGPKLLTPGRYEVEDSVIDHFAQIIYFAANGFAANDLAAKGGASPAGDPRDADRRHIYRLSLQSGGGPYPYGVAERLTAGAEISTHPHDAIPGPVALASSPQEPMHPVIAEPHGELTPLRRDWLPASYPARQLVTPTQVLLRSRDGLRLHAQMFAAQARREGAARAKHAAIIFVHGGPRRQMLLGYPGMDYYSNAYAMNQYLASRGFVVLSVNYRCGIGYGMEFRQCEHAGAAGASEYQDVLAAVKYLRGREDVDPKRIGIWGGSYGGYLTALALARNSDLFAAGVDFHGVHEWAVEDNAAEDWMRGPAENPRTVPGEVAARAHASSPMADVDKWRSPVLLIHGDDDPEVAYNQTPMLADALRARHVAVEELIFPDEVHDFLLHRDWLAAYEAAAEFFERVLKP